MTVAEQVKQDLTELAKLGVGKRVLPKALAYVDAHLDEVQAYRDSGMKVHEISDLVRSLAK